MINGILAKKIQITSNCRKIHGESGALDEAIKHIRKEYEELRIIKVNEKADFYLYLSVDRKNK